MKKGWKIFWIVCGITALIGLICCVSAFAMGVTKEALEAKFPYGIDWVFHLDHDDDVGETDNNDVGETDNNNVGETDNNGVGETDNNDVVQTDTGVYYSGIREIEGELFAGNIEFIQTEGDEIRVETEGISSRLGFQSYTKDETLHLTTKKNLTNVGNLGNGSIKIYIPQGMRFEEVSMELGAGVLNMDYICADEFSVDAGAGEVNVQSFDATEADFNCGAGSITASGSVRKNLDVESGVGEISLTVDGCKEDYNYEISCGIGEIICGDSSYSGIGHDKYIDNNAAKKINLECGIGKITVRFKQM